MNDTARANRIDISDEGTARAQTTDGDEELAALRARFNIAAAALVDAGTDAERSKAERTLDALERQIAARTRTLALEQAAEHGRRLREAKEEQRRRDEEREAAEGRMRELAIQRLSVDMEIERLVEELSEKLAKALDLGAQMSNTGLVLGSAPFAWECRTTPAWINHRLSFVSSEFSNGAGLGNRMLIRDFERPRLAALLPSEVKHEDGRG